MGGAHSASLGGVARGARGRQCVGGGRCRLSGDLRSSVEGAGPRGAVECGKSRGGSARLRPELTILVASFLKKTIIFLKKLQRLYN